MPDERKPGAEPFDASRKDKAIRSEDADSDSAAALQKANRSLLYSVVWFLVGTAILYYDPGSPSPEWGLPFFGNTLSVGWLAVALAAFNLLDSTLKRFRAAVTDV